MQHVLVHIDVGAGLGPIGAWSYHHGILKHFYPESLDPAISARARDLMAQRTFVDVAVPEWMDLIAEQNPNPLDHFRVFETTDDVTLPAILGEYRRTWATTASD